MTLRSPGRARERIACFGSEGAGKSLGALSIARAVVPNICWVVDNDNAWDRMLENAEWAGVNVREEWRWEGGKLVEHTEYTSMDGTVVLFHVDGWEANVAALREVTARAGFDDWLVIDSATALWGDVQDWYTETVFNEGIEDYFLQVRLEKARVKESAKAGEKVAKTLGAFEGFMDWPVINAQYKKNVGAVLVNPPCHLYITAEQQELAKEEDRETRGLYAEMGVKLKGQKRTGHNVQTVVLMLKGRLGVWKATTVKDRGGREEVEGYEVTGADFADWYLNEIAGWVDDEGADELIAGVKPVAIKAKG